MSEEIEGKALEQTEEENNEVVTTDDVVTKNSVNKAFFILLLLFVAMFSGVAYYGYTRIVMLEKNLAATDSIEGRVLADVNNRIKQSTVALPELRKRLDDLATKQDILTEAVNQPVEPQFNINEDYALAEVEHLLIIASYNLQLDHDVATALSAMEAADVRLTGLRDPMVLNVREQLIADMNELRSLNQADLSGLGLFLSDLINRVDQLPLKENIVVEKPEKIDEPKSDEQLEGIKHFFVLVWEELKSLVVITRDTEVYKARLLPDEIYFLRANLKLELANARFAVFNRDTDNLHASIGHIQVWLNEYFDLSDAAAQNIYDSLLRMKDIELAFPRLDISSSLESVRALIRSQDERNSVTNDEALESLQ
jgi:uroporphyrin-III C-methyltransferase